MPPPKKKNASNTKRSNGGADVENGEMCLISHAPFHADPDRPDESAVPEQWQLCMHTDTRSRKDTQCYDIRELAKWVTTNTVVPHTNCGFNNEQLRRVRVLILSWEPVTIKEFFSDPEMHTLVRLAFLSGKGPWPFIPMSKELYAAIDVVERIGGALRDIELSYQLFGIRLNIVIHRTR